MVCSYKGNHATEKWERQHKRIITKKYKEFFNWKAHAAYSHHNIRLAIKIQWKIVDEILKYNKHSTIYRSLLLHRGDRTQISFFSKPRRGKLSL